MTNLLDLPADVINSIHEYVIKAKERDILGLWFYYWKESVTYYSRGKKYILLYNNAKGHK